MLTPHACWGRAEQVVGVFWRWVAQPLLFGLIGTGLNFHKLRGNIIPRSMGVIFAGACCPACRLHAGAKGLMQGSGMGGSKLGRPSSS